MRRNEIHVTLQVIRETEETPRAVGTVLHKTLFIGRVFRFVTRNRDRYGEGNDAAVRRALRTGRHYP